MSRDGGRSGGEFSKEVDALVDGAAGLLDNLKEIFDRSRDEVVRAAERGRVRLDVFQLRKDREALVMRLGERALELVEAGSVQHPGLRQVVGEIAALDREIEEQQAGLEAAEGTAASAGAASAAARTGPAASAGAASAGAASAAAKTGPVDPVTAAPIGKPSAKVAGKQAAAKKPGTRKPASKKSGGGKGGSKGSAKASPRSAAKAPDES
jgi:hypothetical protein